MFSREMKPYIAHLTELQTEIILALTYVIVVLPIWAILRLTRRDLLESQHAGWHQRTRSADPYADLHLPF